MTAEKLLKYISEEDKINMDYFYLEGLSRDYRIMESPSEIPELLLPKEVSYEDNEVLLDYSGFNYRHINACLRGTWNYEENGNIANMDYYRKMARRLSEIIMTNSTTLNDNMMVYRGVSLDYFKQYGIETLNDLKKLENGFMLDLGFVSTSVMESQCFFQKENELGKNYNVKIEYMVPSEFSDGIFLQTSSSYSPNQQEFLINSANLSRVSNVSINEDGTAVVRAMFLPKELYDDYYKNKSSNPETK